LGLFFKLPFASVRLRVAQPAKENFMEKIYDKLVEMAELATAADEVPVSAVIIDENQNIIAKSSNKMEATKNPLKHAEVICLNEAFEKADVKQLNEFTMIVTLEPCGMCASAAAMARLKKCIFLVKDEKGGGVLHNAKIPITQKNLFKTEFEYRHVPQSEKLKEILQDFFKKKR
jgi:tRNA(adenine34) deaminase